MSVTVAEKSCLDCIFYNSTERYCVLWGTYLSSYEPCEHYRTSWGQIRWLRSFLERFAFENLKRSMPKSGGGR